MQTKPLSNWSEDVLEQCLQDVMQGGWSRMRPYALTFLLVSLTTAEAPPTRQDLALAPLVHNSSNPGSQLDLSCWEDVSTLHEDERAARPAELAAAARYAAHYGLPPMQTVNDVITLLIAAQVIHEIPDTAGVARLYPAHPVPAPVDVFPLDEEEAAIQRQLRFEAAYEGHSYRIIELFAPEGERRKEITTSLERLARVIDSTPDDARQAVRLLVNGGDFTTTLDITELPPHKVFRLRCDWAQFDDGRIGIHGMTEDGRIEVTLPTRLTDPTDEHDREPPPQHPHPER
ncbi:DUF6042 family protein [Streptomyces botrytidirepellens]|uniref:Uncharacterized protein n=1 Tax=Streptomyces botrytidirepellens TaxID=2486417 RepID=A0A3M8WG73_9ACTN|nr:DUF6042 family protein [Streptomyces botrytidirepellens]RNG27759.1 hypothetical protein EEJ42_13000 [Streptomyces botrytidirepellens]